MVEFLRALRGALGATATIDTVFSEAIFPRMLVRVTVPEAVENIVLDQEMRLE